MQTFRGTKRHINKETRTFTYKLLHYEKDHVILKCNNSRLKDVALYWSPNRRKSGPHVGRAAVIGFFVAKAAHV